MDRGRKNVPISLQVIGRIQTPFVEATGTPIQSVYAQGAKGQVIVADSFAAALDDIEGFDRVWLVYWLDRATAFQPRVVPYRDTRERGLFATRSPCRPNPIGMSAVRLVRREGCILHVIDIDVLDDTPLLDIKPYVPEFDAHPSAKEVPCLPARVVVIDALCDGCGVCAAACPHQAISMIARDKCEAAAGRAGRHE